VLSDWERQQLLEIERELSSDASLAHELAKLSGQGHGLPGFWQRFYPVGYLLSAVTYMLMSMAGTAAKGLGGTLVVVWTVWVAEQLRRSMQQRSARRSSVARAG